MTGNSLVRRVLFLASLAFPCVALAHPTLVSSVPAKDATLVAAPRELRLVFSEGVELALSSVTLEGPDGKVVTTGKPTRAADSTKMLVVPITGAMSAGKYTVKWRAAGKDGHTERGEYSFTVAKPADAVPVTAPAQRAPFNVSSPAYVAVRFLRYASMLALIGAVTFALGVLPRVRVPLAIDLETLRERVRTRVATIARWAVGLLLVSSLLRVAAQVVSVGDIASLRDISLYRVIILDTGWGRAWMIEVAVAAFVFFSLRRARGPAWGRIALAVPFLALAAALSGHAVSVEGRAGIAVIVDALHVLAAAGWAGGVFMLIAAGIPGALTLEPDTAHIATQAIVHAFSPNALAWTAVLLCTGAVTAWLHLGGLPALWQTLFGRILMLKLSALGAMAAVGAYNWRRVLPTLGTHTGTARIRRSAGFEATLAVCVIAITAILVATPTPMGGTR